MHDGAPVNTFINLGTTGMCHLIIKISVTETGDEGLRSTYMAQKTDHWRALVIVKVKLRNSEIMKCAIPVVCINKWV